MTRSTAFLGLVVFSIGAAAGQTTPAASSGGAGDKADAYYHYALGHLYAELAAGYGNRGDYFNKAIDNYRAAMKDDPSASFLSEELSDLYIQSGRLREAVTEAEDALKQNPNDLNQRRLLARIYTRLIGDPQQNRIDENMLHKAIEQYQKIAAQEPKDTDSLLMLGRLEKVAQNSVEAENAYKKVLDLDPNNEDALTGLAMVYNDLGDNKSAAELLRRAAQKTPTARTLTALASTYEQMHDYSLAAATLRRALDQSPANSDDVKHALAQDLLLSDQLDDSLKLYEEMAAADPKDVQSELRISQIYRQQGDFAKAQAANDKAKALDPENLEIRYNEVNLLEAEGKLPQAIAALKDMLDSTSKHSYTAAERGNRVVLVERLGLLYRSNEQYKEAVATFGELADLDPDSGARAAAQIVDTYRMAKDFTSAERESATAFKKYPNDRVVASVRASVLADMGKNDEAVAITKKLLDGKNDREVYLSLAQIYDKMRNFPEMANSLDMAEKLSQSKDDKVGVYFMRGGMYEKQKKYDEAEAEFRKLLVLDPNNASALNYLGYMLAERDVHLPEALDLVSKALKIEPNNGAYLDSLGWVFFHMNRLPEAADNLKRSLSHISRDPTVHDHLGDVYFKQGKVKDAIAQWQSSLKEWDAGSPADAEPDEIATVQKKLESAKVRLAKEDAGAAGKQ
ncbi:MAG: tetratricopeptide repeat protein [Bryobacteraceae bacterium]